MLDDALLRILRGAEAMDAEDLFLRVALVVALREYGMDWAFGIQHEREHSLVA